MSRPRLHHGVDLVYVPRVREMLARHAHFETRVFTAAERATCRRHPDPAPHFAARFAAKEAALKALGLGLLATGVDRKLARIEVVREGGAPELRLGGAPAERARRLGVVQAALSLTHEGDHALASVVLLSEVEA
jgi:holo-[acyl-carrier protein] synthase